MFLTPGHFARTQKWTIPRAFLPEGDYSNFEGSMRLRTFSFYCYYCFKDECKEYCQIDEPFRPSCSSLSREDLSH